MTQETIAGFFALLRSAMCGEPLSSAQKAALDTAAYADIAALAEKHDLAHLLALGLEKNGLPTDGAPAEALMKAVYRHEQARFALAELCAALETAGILFMPLKGAVIGGYYPEPWMRTSCDIDVLVRPEDADAAAAHLVDTCGYTRERTGEYDVSLFSANRVHIELHFALLTDGAAAEVLADVWRTATVREGYTYWYDMADDLRYVYHIAHMAKHIVQGGCGVRPFIDLFVLDGLADADRAARDSRLAQSGLQTFAAAARRLSRVWLAAAVPDDTAAALEWYILRGGMYGSSENRIVVQQQKQGGSLRYAWAKIFLPYAVLQYQYPIIQKHRWLTPFMEVRRWCKLVFCGHARRTVNELRYNSAVSADEAAQAQAFLHKLGL